MTFIDISIPLRFGGPQPNAFGAEPAMAKTLGDTRTGSSVNFEQYTLAPHCSGTHTECVGHITHERISILDCLRDIVTPALLISVEPELAENDDLVISRGSLEAVMVGTEMRDRALVIRSLPNNETKLDGRYDEANIPPYLSADAMEFIVECGIKHLLVDLPSVDRLFDEGELVNHRLFWNVERGSNDVNSATRRESTITELIYVPDEVADGKYLLNLQIAPFATDAAPSRPVLFDRVFESGL